MSTTTNGFNKSSHYKGLRTFNNTNNTPMTTKGAYSSLFTNQNEIH